MDNNGLIDPKPSFSLKLTLLVAVAAQHAASADQSNAA